MEDNKHVNYRYWLANTIKATQAHSVRLAGLCGCLLDVDSVAGYLTDIVERRERDEQSSPFPERLRGRLRDAFQPKHLMLKLACVRDAEAGIDYEFLMEYGLFEPATGIYFGVKAVSDSLTSSDEFISDAEEAVERLIHSAPRLFSNPRLRQLPLTDNAEDGTYWPMWIPCIDCRDLKEEVGLLHSIYGSFIKSHPGMTPLYNVFGDFLTLPANGEEPLAGLLDVISLTFGSQESAECFLKFLKNACRRGILADCGDGRWRFHSHWGMTQRNKQLKMTKKAAFDLVTILFSVMASHYHVSRQRFIPWQHLCEVFLDKDSKPFDSSWQRQPRPVRGIDYYARCEALCRELLELPLHPGKG